MNLKTSFWIVVASMHGALAVTVGASESVTINTGSGSFIVPGGDGRESRTIEVHYHRPTNLDKDSPVMIVIPGAGRNGDDYRDSWKEAAERFGVLVLSPGYSEKHYPEYWSYNLANMPASVTLDLQLKIDTNPSEWQLSEQIDNSEGDTTLTGIADNSRLMKQIALLTLSGMVVDVDANASGLTVNKDRSAWIYGDFDRIFGIARDALGLDTETYDLFGHSAGGQILHRYALFHPNSRANRIVAANSGWYTLPDINEPFPYGLGDTGMRKDEITHAFQSNLVVFLGEKDDEHETRGSLRETPEANRQGPGRRQRGEYFFAAAQATARQLETGLNWKLKIVPGIGHDYRAMSHAAAGYLYSE